MKVLLWSPHGAGEHYGGPGTAAFRMYAQPAARDLEVTLAHGFEQQAHYREVFTAEHFVAAAVKKGIVRIAGVSVPHPGRAIQHGRFLREARGFIRAHAREYDVFHGLMAYDQTVRPAADAERAGLPAIVKVAQQGAELAEKGGIMRLLGRVRRRRALLARLHGVIALTRAIADELIAAGVPEAAIAHIPNGVDVDRFRPAESARDRTVLRSLLGWRDVPTVLFVGAVIERKRPHLLVDAVAHLHASGVACQLAVVGPASERDYLRFMQDRIARHGLEPHVVWSDFRSDIELCYRAADVFCLPSRSEGLSNAVLEAMASALPVVMTPVSGAADIAAGEDSGAVVADANATALAQALRGYLDDSTVCARHGAAAREHAVSRVGHERVLNLHTRLFEHVLRGGAPAEVAPL